ncbi:hypothetical protein HK100_006854 [Physocladia obscura]|uniref:Glycoside hydrolase 35 catalytic domain-containing protein n=1 Tax=Physocladia obscura TaxID=109957 RepID=A0AAD5TB50_9FUNG|nr:hypothetical protein HK100_006854 [Physocladia obscura]
MSLHKKHWAIIISKRGIPKAQHQQQHSFVLVARNSRRLKAWIALGRDSSVWPSLLRRIKAAGNNAVDTYVFWNIHESAETDQPAMVTEMWKGWFKRRGEPQYTRFGEDVAFATARFIARGGTYLAYYMWHGGANFRKWGADSKTTSFDYDAMLTEYGFPNIPKHDVVS